MKASRALASSSAWLAVLVAPSVALAQPFVDVQDIATSFNAVELIYSPAYASLVAKNTASTIEVIATGTGSTSTQGSNYSFTDMSLSPDGRYVFAADYGGENIGYGTPANQSAGSCDGSHRVGLPEGARDGQCNSVGLHLTRAAQHLLRIARGPSAVRLAFDEAVRKGELDLKEMLGRLG
jgi:hypothetical protein